MTDDPRAPRPVAFGTRLGVAGASALIYFVALLVPALEFQVIGGELSIWPGYLLAASGPYALLVGNIGWLANLVYLPSLVLLLIRWWRGAAASAAAAALVALHTLALLGEEIPSDASGNTKMMLVDLHVGFYLWVASMVAVIAGALWCRRRE